MKLKANALRTLFDIHAPQYTSYDDSSLRGAPRAEFLRAVAALDGVSNGADSIVTANLTVSDTTKDRAIYNRWGYYKHPEHKGALYYAQQDPHLWGKTQIGVVIYDTITQDPRPRTQYAMSLWGEQTDSYFKIKGGRMRVTLPDEAPEFVNVPVQSPFMERLLVLASISYEQLQTETGIDLQQNMEFLQTTSEEEVIAEFDSRHPDLIL